MANSFRRSIPLLMATVFGTGVIGIAGVAYAQTQGDPPARVARLAFEQGTVSFHDSEDANWTPAQTNDALTTGDSLWTEPNARSELSVAGTRVRMDQSTQLDMLQIDDSSTRMQLDQGRLDIKTYTLDTAQPYEIVTPRGTVKLEAQGDYYVESGSTEDPTRLGVRTGAAQITGLNGQVLAVRAGEVGEITGDAATPQLHTIKTAPPPMPAYWAQRDQQISYDAPQYISSDVVGYEDMQAYGAWSNDPEYGEVWSPNSVPSGWQPYSTGSWAYSQPYGWTWVDEQPWGFAPYHYGRWANRNNRWYWVPPERREHAVYAPALVAFVAGAELSIALGNANSQPVGWFPLGPREAYVPPYTNDRNYYNRVNANARVERAVLDDRWQRAERHEAIQANQQNERMANRRFTTVVPAQAFVSSQHVSRSAIKVSADKLASAPVLAVSAPPPPAQGSAPKANTRFNGVQELARPPQAQRQEQHRDVPGPKIAAHTQPPAPGAKPNPPALQPRHGAPPPTIQGERTQAPQQTTRPEPPKPGQPAAPPAVQGNRAEPPKPGEAAKPGEPPRPPQAQRPAETGHPPVPPAPHQAETPRAPQAQAPKPAETHAAPAQPAPQQKAAEPPRAPEQHQAQQPPRPAEHQVTPPAPHQAEAPHATPAAPPHAPPAAPPQPQHVQAPPPVQHAPAPPPQQAHAPAPPPQAAPHPAAPPPQAPHPATAPAPNKPAAPPQQAEHKEEKK